MRKFLFGTIVLMGCMMAQAQNEQALVQAVRAKLEKVNNYTAKGRMTVDVPFINAPQSGVVVYFKKPNRFKVVKDGGISILPKGGVSINMATLLSGNDYTVVPAGKVNFKGKVMRAVKLLPLAENSDVVLTTLYIDEALQVIRRAAVTTRESGSYEMELDYAKYVPYGLPDRVVFLFNTKDYKLPKGVTFEYEKSGPKKPAPDPNKKGRIQIDYTSYSINKGVDDKVF